MQPQPGNPTVVPINGLKLLFEALPNHVSFTNKPLVTIYKPYMLQFVIRAIVYKRLYSILESP